jgi:hypothetical protein
MAAKPKKKKNGTRYNQDAIELARSLYCKYGGKNLDAVQREMRKAGYPGWLKRTCSTKVVTAPLITEWAGSRNSVLIIR